MYFTSIIIITYNQLEMTKACLASIEEFSDMLAVELIFVDNASNDGTVEWLKTQSGVKCIFNEDNKGFPIACNQGIEIATGTEILLLNNDTLVTPNWLENLLRALYSKKEIGAVGPVTNYASNYQAIPVKYKSGAELLDFAKKYNVSDNNKWEEKLKLVGFCMLIKREVINRVGLLDERYSPGHFEDDDYSYRILEAGYKILLCHDTFIHHIGSVSFKKNPNEFQKIVANSRKMFKEKWGFDAIYSTYCRQEVIDLIDDINKPNICILEVGCACGATLLKIKNTNRTAKLYGIELSEGAAKIAQKMLSVSAQNIENKNLSYAENFFDYIIFADVLEHLQHPTEVLMEMRKYLKNDGKVLASIPNVQHISVVKDLLQGGWDYQEAGILDKTNFRFFTGKSIHKMFQNANFKAMEYRAVNTPLSDAEKNMIEKLDSIGFINDKRAFSIVQYLVKAQK